MATELIHRAPCPRSGWAAPTGKAVDVCACPDGWPRYYEEPKSKEAR